MYLVLLTRLVIFTLSHLYAVSICTHARINVYTRGHTENLDALKKVDFSTVHQVFFR